MNVLFLLFGLLAVCIVTIIAIVGACRKKVAIVVVAFVLAVILAIGLLIVQMKPCDAQIYRIVYSKENVIVVIDDEDGKTTRYDLNDVTHADVNYAVGDKVVVVFTGVKNTAYIAPSDHAIITPSNEPASDE